MKGRGLRRIVVVACLAVVGVLAGAGGDGPVSTPTTADSAPAPPPPVFRVLAVRQAIDITEPRYRLLVDRDTGLAQVASPAGILYTSLPLTALLGRAAFPRGTRARVERTATGLVVDTVAPTGDVLVSATVTTAPGSFTVGFTATVGSDATDPALFFANGHRALDLRSIGTGYTPDPAQPTTTSTPRVDTAVRTPLAPAPFDVEMEASPGWMGLGLVQVPDATSLALLPTGAVTVNYPLGAMASATAGGNPVTFSDFVVTFGPTPLDGLRAYHDALVGLDAAPATPEAGPSWWDDPIVDTWGEQIATRRMRMSAGFTAAWVRSFARDVRKRYGLTRATIVIDSAWQARIGDPEPDPARFGGWDGMRQLIGDLHDEGFHVLLWWPMWARDIRTIPPARSDMERAGPAHLVDPGATGFDDTMASAVESLLGGGPDGLDADGLKLDWAYNIPTSLSAAGVTGGAAALYHYIAVIHDTAHAVHPGAIIEASAAAPQFQRVTDSVRLYDAWSEAAWDERAAIVAAADPGVLIDGDGFETSPSTAVVHAVASTVYGVPALYVDEHYPDGSLVSAATAHLVGMVMALASGKGPGTAARAPGGWTWTGADGTVLTTLAGGADILRWHAGTCGGSGLLAATAPGSIDVGLHLPARAALTATAGGRRVAVRRQAGGIRLSLVAGEVVDLTATC